MRYLKTYKLFDNVEIHLYDTKNGYDESYDDKIYHDIKDILIELEDKGYTFKIIIEPNFFTIDVDCKRVEDETIYDLIDPLYHIINYAKEVNPNLKHHFYIDWLLFNSSIIPDLVDDDGNPTYSIQRRVDEEWSWKSIKLYLYQK